ncbi:putative Rhodanese-like domain-containing protein [Lupinus albus]|uniref:Putative Rhodanese-like domain-containing protein n=1 Tax=Lupinus albus TaxID=3870 RepID=A0A6A4QWG4_LUPAL|nr:putative Rhodanese-like domain-containing protein [Lupinus albus]
MDSLSLLFSSYPLLSIKTHKFSTFKPFSSLSNHNPSHSLSSLQPLSSTTHKKFHFSSFQTHSTISLQNLPFFVPFHNLLSKSFFSFTIIQYFTSLPSLASVTEVDDVVPSVIESDAGKINIESILVSIDDFINRYPFFVAGCTFIWLVVIPLTEEYLKKCKFVSAIDAFRKLRDDPFSQLLDIRDRKNLKFLGSPNLKIVKKEVVQVEFSDGNEDGFVKKVLERFSDAPNTVLCVLDSFDGNSMKVAELLFKNGFKEAYAIKGGVRGPQGWMAIQDTLLPPSAHIFRRKKTKASKQLHKNGNGAIQKTESNYEGALSQDTPVVENQETDNGHVKRSVKSAPDVKIGSVASSSPYPNYPDLKPPSSPTPSKPH